MRLQKYMAMCGVAARRKCEEIIASGRVRVNGQVVDQMGAQVEEGDVVELDGVVITTQEQKRYILYHKPAGVVTATEDKRLLTVVSLLPEIYQRRKIGPVGRLDRDVTGLVLLTTDGQLAHRLISPRWKAEKCYRARCEGALDANDVAAFAGGLMLSDFTAAPARLEILESGETSLADVILTEGKFHQVKRMFLACGRTVTYLKRLQIGALTLDPALAPGEWRELTEEEVALLGQDAP